MELSPKGKPLADVKRAVVLPACFFALSCNSFFFSQAAAQTSITKYIQEEFSVPEVAEAFRHSDAVELERTADGIRLKTGYLGSTKPQSALKAEEIRALEALAARDNLKEDGLPVFTLGDTLREGYTIKYNGNVLKVRHVSESGKSSEAVIEDGAVVYAGAHVDTTVFYSMSPGRCQEMLLLKSEKAPKQFEYEYSKEVGLNEKGEITVNGLTLSRPVIFDATGRRVNGSYRKTSRKRVLLTFTATGLRYPLLIDPTWQALAGSMNALRQGHVALLLPNGQVLVAGGTNNTGPLSSAELYNPATGTFAPTGSMPGARSCAAAVLLPNGKVLITGGADGVGLSSSADLYDPAAGTFSATGSMSAGRYEHTLTLLPNGKVLVAGSRHAGTGASLSSAELYDPDAGTFSLTGSMTAAYGYHTATLLPNGKVLFTGGVGLSGIARSSAELYDPAAGTFSATGSMSAARYGHTATLLPNGKVLVVSGFNVTSAELYDPASGTFSTAGSLSVARLWHIATLLPNGKVLVTGGCNVTAAELYDPASNTFSPTGSMSAVRYDNHSATLLPDGRVLIAGGHSAGADSLSSAELYVLSGGSGTFSAIGSMSGARGTHSAILLPNGKVLVVGGKNTAALSSVELYDPAIGTFAPTGSMTVERQYPAAILLPNGKVLVVGGATLLVLDHSADLYDPATGTFSATGSMSDGRYMHTATLLPNGKVLVAGSRHAGTGASLSSAELYDPAAGTFSATGSMTAAYGYHTATLLPNGKVLFTGGQGVAGVARSSAELYDPAAGTFSSTGSMSSARQGHTATLLPNGKVLVACGYNVASAELYDPAAGTFSATGSSSAPRQHYAATLLPNGKVLVTGGISTANATTPSAELYDPAAGTFMSAGSMSAARQAHTATLLPDGRVLIVGGSPSSGVDYLSSAELYDVVFSSDATVPAAVSSLAAVPGAYVGALSLSWPAPGSDGNSRTLDPGSAFYVQYDTCSSVSWSTASAQVIQSTSGVTPTSLVRYNIGALDPGTTYYLAVWHKDEAGNLSGISNIASSYAKPFPAGAVASAPELSATASGISSVTWSWAAVQYADGYRTISSTGGALSGDLAQAVLSWNEEGLSPNIAYVRMAAVFNFFGASTSAAVTRYTLAAAPSGLTTSVFVTSSTLNWGLNGNPAGTTAQVFRSTDSSAYSAVFSGGAVSYGDTGLQICATYYYKVRNLNGDGLSTAYTSTVSVVTADSIPLPPNGLEAASLAGRLISLSWAPSPDPWLAYYRLYSDGGSGAVDYGSPVAVLTSTVTSFVTGVLVSSPSYIFALRAVNRCGIEETNTRVLASAAALNSLTGVRTAIKEPHSGKKVSGNRLTVIAEIILGEPFQVAQVRFQYKASASAAWLDIVPANANHSNPDSSAPYFVHWDVSAFAAGNYDLRAVASDNYGSADEAAPAVTVMVDNGDYDVRETLQGDGKTKKEQVINNAVTSVVQAANAEQPWTTKISIPSEAVSVSTATFSIINNPAGAPVLDALSNPTGQVIEINLSNSQHLLSNGQEAEIELTYQDADGNGLVDGTSNRADKLRIFSYDPLTMSWKDDLVCSVDQDQHKVIGRTRHFSFFAVFAPVAANINAACRMYPNPWKPGSGGVFDASGVTFANLDTGGTVRIFTIAGELVRELNVSAADARVKVWDGKNSSGSKVASGVYIVRASFNGTTRIFRLAVER